MTTSSAKSAAFLLGFSFAFLPSFGPFLAVLFFLAGRWQFIRLDALWAAAALCFAAAMGIRDGTSGFAFGVLQILGPWLVYRSFFHLRSLPVRPNGSSVVMGLVAGLAAIISFGWLQGGAFSPAYKTLTQAISWSTSPAFYGHTVLVLGSLIAVVAAGARVRILAMALAALGVLVAGSREAAMAWIVVMVVLFLVNKSPSVRSRVVEASLLTVMLAVSAGLGPLFGWGNFGFLLNLVSPSTNQNLIQGSELSEGDWWDDYLVDAEAGGAELSGVTLTTYQVEKRGQESWLRLQQVVPLRQGEIYTVSTWLRPVDGSQPGIQGWGQLVANKKTFVLSAVLEDDKWQANTSGPGRLLNSGVAAVEGEWRRVFATFIYEGEQPLLYWYVGLAPDRRPLAETSAQFAGFSLEASATLNPYVPGPATRGLSLDVARIPYWQAAWQGIQDKPWLGWGKDSFSAYYQQNWANYQKLGSLPSHVHNFFLHILFERGLLGLLGFALLITALTSAAIRSLDYALLAVLFATLFINFFDVTFFYGGVLYPLVAVVGWRAASVPQVQDRLQQTSARQLGVSLALVATDYVAACVAFATAVWLTHPAEPVTLTTLILGLAYALLLWPVMAWREGLYPGYGLTAAQELRKHVTASAYAGLIFAAGTVLFYDYLPVQRSTLLVTLALSTLLLPLGRASLKRLLLRYNLWGRPVYILGAGQAGKRVALLLQRSPLEGLNPIAFFDDDKQKHGLVLRDLPVLASLGEADSYAQQQGITHAIIAIPTMTNMRLRDFIHQRSRAFRYVQFVPELSGLPAEDVSASPLAGMLALEFRNGLYSKRNRLFKRVLDLLGSVTGMVAALPLLATLALWIKLDSKGPVFYGGERIGQGGRAFRCLKFRTMYVDAEARLEEVLASNPGIRREYTLYHKLEHDPRITPAGRFLRRFSLDELPQLFNVIAGDMSLVGPRPYMTREREDIGAYGETIFEAKPGLTGYWQVSGRNTVTFQERLEMEAHYVRNWSPWWDIVLLTQTLPVVLKREGAS